MINHSSILNAGFLLRTEERFVNFFDCSLPNTGVTDRKHAGKKPPLGPLALPYFDPLIFNDLFYSYGKRTDRFPLNGYL